MLLNKGELNAVRLLGRRTVELMASNHVGDLFAKGGRTGGRPGKGFGLTVDVVLDEVETEEHRSTGSFGWSGAFGTTFWVDPKEQLTAVLMVQTPGGSLRADFQNAVMQAIAPGLVLGVGKLLPVRCKNGWIYRIFRGSVVQRP